jgi:putative flavoprotein involved in K+ transport
MDRSDGAAAQIAADWLSHLEDTLARCDASAAAELFGRDGYWRDLVAFSWNIATFEGRAAIRDMLAGTLATAKPSGWRIDGEPEITGGVLTAWFDFETALGRGRGCFRLKDGAGWTMFTALLELRGYEEKRGPTREEGIELGARRGRSSWQECYDREVAALGRTEQPFCVIVGASQCGLALAARLKQLDVPTIVVDKFERPGESWRARYKSLCLHDPVWSDHMPYLPFPDHWPVYTPKDRMADWLEMYAKVMALNVWCDTTCERATYDEATGTWRVEVTRAGERLTLRPRHLVLATGLSGMPQMPVFPGAAEFRGTLVHSSQYRGADGYAGKRCVVIGSNNSAHDICADLWEQGGQVTMVQRSPTLVVRLESLRRAGDAGPYSEAGVRAGITTDQADLAAASMPFALMHHGSIANYQRIRQWDAAFYDRLGRSGFKFHFGEDESGVLMMYLRRASGYYIDVGASDLIAEGKIHLRAGLDVARLGRSSVVLSDDSELPADLVVCATGYGPMDGWAAKLISPEVAAKVGRCWGLGSGTRDDPGPWEGELRNMWKPTRQPGLWFHGGNLAQARHYSRYLALQLKARYEGMPTPVFAAGK